MSEPMAVGDQRDGQTAAVNTDVPDQTQEPGVRRRRQPHRQKFEQIAIGGGVVIVLLVVWQLVAGHATSDLILPTPTDVWSTFQSYAKGDLGIDASTSGKELGYGYLIATVLGIPLGILAGWYTRLRYAVSPFLWFFYSVPIIALTPLIIVWVGFGLESKVIVVALASFFPIMVNTMSFIQNPM